jgi:nitrous oxidase accessory protein NosD
LYDIKDIGIYNLVSAGRVTIANCKLEITGQNGIYATYCEPMDIIGNELSMCGNASYASIHLASTYYNRIIGNKITHDGSSNSAHGIIMETACYSDIVGNTIVGANIGYREYAAVMLSQQGNCVIGNNVKLTYSYGMQNPGANGSCVGNTIDSAGDVGIITGWQDCLLEGNTISYSTFHAIQINSLHYQCIGNSIYIAQMHGIIIRGGAEGVCSGNIVYDSCYGFTNVYTAIYLIDSSGQGVKRNIIADNYIYSDSYPLKQAYGIWEAHSLCNYNIIHDNLSHGSVRQEIATQGLYTKVHDNIVNS